MEYFDILDENGNFTKIMIKNIIFDVDRTLVDSYRIELETLNQALFIVTGKVYNNKMNELTLLPTNELFKNLGIEKNSDEIKKINYWWEKLLLKRKISFFNGVKEMLIKLKESGFFLGIVTSRTEDELNELEELKKNIDLFNIVITSDKVIHSKPHPESINIIIRKFNLNKKETIYIGDSEIDAITAKNANVFFGYASWENKSAISKYDYLFEQPADIIKIFEKFDRELEK